MQEARKVVEFSQSRRATGPAGNRILDDCGELAANQLTEALGKAMERAGKELHKLAAQTPNHQMSMLYLEGMEFLRDHGNAIEVGFRQGYFKAFKQSCRNGWLPERSSTPADQLSLVEPDDLEETLAATNLANALHNDCGEELFGLNQRVGLLLGRGDLCSEDNPLGPELIARAILDSLKEQGGTLKVRLTLVPVLGRYLPERVKTVYQALNRFLVDKGILPALRVGVRKSRTEGEGAAAAAPAVQATQADLSSLLQQLLAVGSHGPTAGTGLAAGVLPAAGAAGATVNVSPVFLQTLTQLQRGETRGLDLRGLDPARLSDGHVNVLRELKTTSIAAGMGQVHATTLDIVALIFDYILDDRRVPDAMKALIGRLQIPVLKVAMLDRAFFSQRAHPTRRLLDVLAEVSMGWDPQEGHESGLYRKVDEIVNRILNDFDDKVEVFQAALEDLERYLAEEKRQIDVRTARGAQVLLTREQREIAEAVAHDTIHTQLFSHPTPALIQDFLYGTWHQLLTLIYSRHGEDSEPWRSAVQTMADLIWSAAPKTTAEDRRLLVQRLPNMLKRLSDGFRTLGAPQEEQDRFFAALVKCHAEAVKSGMHGTPAQTEAAVSAPPPCREQPLDFETLPVPGEPVEVAPTLLQDIAATPIVGHPDIEEITVTDVGWLAGGEPQDDRYEAELSRLKRGTWIEYRQEDGSTARAKLAWISPMRGLYLFTNRLGERAMSISAHGLAAKLREGQIQILDDVPLMDRAVDALLSRLQNTA